MIVYVYGADQRHSERSQPAATAAKPLAVDEIEQETLQEAEPETLTAEARLHDLDTRMRSDPKLRMLDSPRSLELLNDPDPAVKAEVLQWSAAAHGAGFAQAMAKALADSDNQVQETASELLMAHGMNDQGLAEATAAARAGDARRARELVSALPGD